MRGFYRPLVVTSGNRSIPDDDDDDDNNLKKKKKKLVSERFELAFYRACIGSYPIISQADG